MRLARPFYPLQPVEFHSWLPVAGCRLWAGNCPCASVWTPLVLNLGSLTVKGFLHTQPDRNCIFVFCLSFSFWSLILDSLGTKGSDSLNLDFQFGLGEVYGKLTECIKALWCLYNPGLMLLVPALNEILFVVGFCCTRWFSSSTEISLQC